MSRQDGDSPRQVGAGQKDHSRRLTDWSKRCPACWMQRRLCLCSTAPKLETSARVLVVMDMRESHQTTNTGHLVTLGLADAEVRVRSRHDDPDVGLEDLADPSRRVCLLFPGDDAEVLSPQWVAADPRPVTLVVPDGVWRTCRRMVRKIPALSSLPRVLAPPGPPATLWLREPPTPQSLPTMLAIARAMGVLEGQERGAAVQAALERLTQVMMERHLWSRGLMPAERVTGGVPP